MSDLLEQVSRILDNTERCMRDAQERTSSADLATTRVLHALVTMLSRQFLPSHQQSQVEEILSIHESCIRSSNAERTASTNTVLFGQEAVQARLSRVNGRLAAISRSHEHPHMKRVRALVAVAPLLEQLSTSFLADEQQEMMQQLVEVFKHL